MDGAQTAAATGQEPNVAELATAAWRLGRWLDTLEGVRTMPAKSSMRLIRKYLDALGVEVRDPAGTLFDPGLAMDVVANQSDWTLEGDLYVLETIVPSVYHQGRLLQRARVVIGRGPGGDVSAPPVPGVPAAPSAPVTDGPLPSPSAEPAGQTPTNDPTGA